MLIILNGRAISIHRIPLFLSAPCEDSEAMGFELINESGGVYVAPRDAKILTWKQFGKIEVRIYKHAFSPCFNGHWNSAAAIQPFRILITH